MNALSAAFQPDEPTPPPPQILYEHKYVALRYLPFSIVKTAFYIRSECLQENDKAIDTTLHIATQA